jgi:hypothetical protein
MRVPIEMINATRVKGGGASFDSVNLIALAEQQFG